MHMPISGQMSANRKERACLIDLFRRSPKLPDPLLKPREPWWRQASRWPFRQALMY